MIEQHAHINSYQHITTTPM